MTPLFILLDKSTPSAEKDRAFEKCDSIIVGMRRPEDGSIVLQFGG